MQNRDGGWAAFDRDINREVLTKVPFADHNAMLDPSCPDITARVLEALAAFGYGAGPAPGRARPALPRARRRTRAAAGRAAGASTTSTAPGRCCSACAPSASTWTGPLVRRAVALARLGAAARRRLGRELPQLRRPGARRPRRGRRPRRRPGPCSACSPPARSSTRRPRAGVEYLLATQRRRRRLARGAVHRHRLPEGVLPEISPVQPLLPAHGAGALRRASAGGRRVEAETRREASIL